MKYCKNCKLQILDETEICPLCKNVLRSDDMEWNHTIKDPYPDFKSKKRAMDFLMRLFLFLVVAASVICIFINYQVNPEFLWSAIVVGGGCVFLWIFSLLCRETGYIQRIFSIVIGILGLVVLIDLVTGANGWSWNYAMPAAMLFVDVVFLLLMLINRRNWQGYMLYQILMIVIAIIPLALIALGIVDHPLVSELAIISAILVFLGTLIIGGRTARLELGRRFRI